MKKMDTTCLELTLNPCTELAEDKISTWRCKFVVNSSRHWVHFAMNEMQSDSSPETSCALFSYSCFFFLLFLNICSELVFFNECCLYVVSR